MNWPILIKPRLKYDSKYANKIKIIKKLEIKLIFEVGFLFIISQNLLKNNHEINL